MAPFPPSRSSSGADAPKGDRPDSLNLVLYASDVLELDELTRALEPATRGCTIRGVTDLQWLVEELSEVGAELVVLLGVDPQSKTFKSVCRAVVRPATRPYILALTDVERAAQCLENGATDWLTTGAPNEVLLARVASAVELQNTRRKLQKAQARLMLGDYNDPLTGLANRRRMETFLRGELERVRRGIQGLGIAVFSLDHFGLVNETLGNRMGDAVLVDVAESLTSRCRDYDKVARWHGKIFLVAFPATTLRGADSACRRQYEALRDRSWKTDGDQFWLTASVGLAYVPAHAEESVESLVARAEAAALTAKEDGRDRISAAEGNRAFAANRRSLPQSSST